MSFNCPKHPDFSASCTFRAQIHLLSEVESSSAPLEGPPVLNHWQVPSPTCQGCIGWWMLDMETMENSLESLIMVTQGDPWWPKVTQGHQDCWQDAMCPWTAATWASFWRKNLFFFSTQKNCKLQVAWLDVVDIHGINHRHMLCTCILCMGVYVISIANPRWFTKALTLAQTYPFSTTWRYSQLHSLAPKAAATNIWGSQQQVWITCPRPGISIPAKSPGGHVETQNPSVGQR